MSSVKYRVVKIEYQVKIVKYRVELVEYQVKIVEYRVKIVEYLVKLVEYRVKIVEYRVELVEYQVKIVEYRVKLVEYRVKIVEYRVELVEYQVKIVEYRVKMVEYRVKNVECPLHFLCTQCLQPLQKMLLMPTPVRQTAHGNLPELCRRSSPVPQIIIFVFPCQEPPDTFLKRFSDDNKVISIEVFPGDPRAELS